MPRLLRFAGGTVGIVCAGQAMHLRAEQALELAKRLAAELLEENK
jgi:hypothetical protein